MSGFLGKKQYAANAPNTLTMKLSKDLCFEYLYDVLQIVVNSLYNESLPSQQPVGHRHDGTSHIVLQFGYQLYAIDEEPLEEFLDDISLVSDKLAIEQFHKRFVVKRFTVVDVARSNHEAEQLVPLVADKVKFETKKTSYRTLAPPGDAIEGLVDMNPRGYIS